MRNWIIQCTLMLGLCGFPVVTRAEAIGWLETFALAEEREPALAQLTPGTEDYFYYHALHAQNQQQYDRVDSLLGPWLQAHGNTPRWQEIKNRQIILRYPQQPAASLRYLQDYLGVHFNHQPPQSTNNPTQPLATHLDPALISQTSLLSQALAVDDTLQRLEPSAWYWLDANALNPSQRQDWLQHLQYPDQPHLVSWIHQHLTSPESQGFGSLPIHSRLLLEQLDELAHLQPELLSETAFVNHTLSRLSPEAGIDIVNDWGARQRYLQRLWVFVRPLNDRFNSLKAQVLYHQLQSDHHQGIYNPQRFLHYLQIPRNSHYDNPNRVNSTAFPHRADLTQSLIPGLPAVGDDEPLVRLYLQQLLQQPEAAGREAAYKSYQRYFKTDYLKAVYAETLLLYGLEKPEVAAALLTPEAYQALNKRVDLDFAATNPVLFQSQQAIQLQLWLKNVSQLRIKVYKINAERFYQTQQRAINTDINLDGLIAHQEYQHTYSYPALRRTLQTFQFPELTQAGIYVIDFIGNGKSSRALIRKGQLHHQTTVTAEGQAIRVFDEQHQALKQARVWLAGQYYEANAEGIIVIPFSTQPKQETLVLSHKDTVSLASFAHQAESYQLQAGFYVDRENLIPGEQATLIIHPQLTLNGTAIALDWLENPQLHLITTDQDGIASSQQTALTLTAQQDSHYSFRVPPRLQKLQAKLTTRIKTISQNKTLDLEVQDQFELNQIAHQAAFESLYLRREPDRCILEMRGLNGELRPHQTVTLTLKHRDFRDPVTVVLQTDPQGQIQLGDLADITQLQAQINANPQHQQQWLLTETAHFYETLRYGAADQALEIPYFKTLNTLSRQDFALFSTQPPSSEQPQPVLIADYFDRLQLKSGRLQVQGLPPGRYLLLLKALDTVIQLQIEPQLDLTPTAPLQLAHLNQRPTTSGWQLELALVNATPTTRVHFIATRYIPEYNPFQQVQRLSRTPILLNRPVPAYSQFVVGRDLGDEYRYILERADRPAAISNGLRRPGLLLNPWAITSTATERQLALGGDAAFAASEAPAVMAPPIPEMLAKVASQKDAWQALSQHWPSYDFLAQPSTSWLNLRPDAQGLIRLHLPPNTPPHLHGLVLDRAETIYRQVVLPATPTPTRDLRLAEPLPSTQHFGQQQQMTSLPAGATWTVADSRNAQFKRYDHLAQVFHLYQTLSQNKTFNEFAFVVEWPQLSAQEQQEKYSQYACHELNLFLYHKDPAFFQRVIKPYLQQKLHKSFMDHWLLGEELAPYQTLARYRQLNTVEKILLAQRIPSLQASTARYLREQLELRPADRLQLNRLFKQALRVNELQEESDIEQAEPPAEPEVVMADALLETEQDAAPEAMTLALANESSRELAFAAAPSKKRAKQAEAKKEAVVGRMRRNARPLYQKPDKTQEWAENNYYQTPLAATTADFIPVNAFWLDYAEAVEKRGFLSPHWIQATRNANEMLLALAVLDLPFVAKSHEVDTAHPPRLQIKLASPAVIYHQQMQAATVQSSPVLVSQNFFRENDPYQPDDPQSRNKRYLTEEFLPHTVYGADVVVTNPSAMTQELEIVLQIPQGAIPVNGNHETHSIPLSLAPYQTHAVTYYFYFPATGQYPHYPAHLTQQGKVIAFAPPVEFKVVAQLSQQDLASWDTISQQGSLQQVIDYLQNHNLQRLDLERIAFRLQHRPAFEQILAVLSQQHIYHPVLWSYALKHGDTVRLSEYLQNHPSFTQQLGLYLQSPWLTLDPITQQRYQQLEYEPLVNARVHPLGAERHILNDRLYQQYQQWLTVLSYKTQWSPQDQLITVYYLLLQDRVDEAWARFKTIPAHSLTQMLQYDTLKAYFAWYQGDFTAVQQLAKRYQTHPISSWKNRFAEMLAQLAEIQGQTPTEQATASREQNQARLATQTPSFEASLEPGQMVIHSKNLQQLQVNYYPMDLELLFSNNPFLYQDSSQLTLIQPNVSTLLTLDPNQTTQRFAIPPELAHRNVMIEWVAAGGKRQTLAYYAHNLVVQFSEPYGFVQVYTAQQQPLAKVYLKIYARLQNGQVQFYKDGYTDWRGRFDYASLSTDELDQVERFSVLVLSTEHGAIVREISPPKQ